MAECKRGGEMTEKRAYVLARLPDRPSDGAYCKGQSLVAAEWLTHQGFAVRVGRGTWVGAYFARTDAGRAALAAHAARQEKTDE